MIAFGPASIINGRLFVSNQSNESLTCTPFEGSVKLLLDKPVQAKSIRVVFSCHEWDQRQEPTKLLSVESVIWSQGRVY